MILARGDVTDFLSVNLTTIIATWLNLLILFLVMKHFLFNKVNKVMEDRKRQGRREPYSLMLNYLKNLVLKLHLHHRKPWKCVYGRPGKEGYW